jgi:RNA polymerase sigma-70 factor (ECF subfamily)
MNEGRRLAAGEAILSEATAPGREHGRELSETEALEDLLESLVREHSRLVYRIAYAVLRRHQDAEDVTQETFVRVLRYSHKLAGVKDHKTWLARIAWRVAVGRGRQSRSKQEIPLEDPEKPLAEVSSTDAAADDAFHGAQLGDVLVRMIAALPENLRQPLVLSTLEEMSPREVAATLGINEAAVRSRVFRARQILREKLVGRIGGRPAPKSGKP